MIESTTDRNLLDPVSLSRYLLLAHRAVSLRATIGPELGVKPTCHGRYSNDAIDPEPTFDAKNTDVLLRPGAVIPRNQLWCPFAKCSRFAVYSYGGVGTGPFPSPWSLLRTKVASFQVVEIGVEYLGGNYPGRSGTMRATIARLRDKPVFEPEAIEAMALALDEACAALAITDSKDRETIAMRVIDLARSGILNADILRDRVLTEAKYKA